MSISPESSSFTYLYLDPGYLGRFKNDSKRTLERYDSDTKVWKTENNTRLIKRFNEDSDTITYEDFQKYVSGLNTSK